MTDVSTLPEPARAWPPPAVGPGPQVDRRRPQRVRRDPAGPGRPAGAAEEGEVAAGSSVEAAIRTDDPLRRPEGSSDQRLPDHGPRPPAVLSPRRRPVRAGAATQRSSRVVPEQAMDTTSTVVGMTASDSRRPAGRSPPGAPPHRGWRRRTPWPSPPSPRRRLGQPGQGAGEHQQGQAGQGVGEQGQRQEVGRAQPGRRQRQGPGGAGAGTREASGMASSRPAVMAAQ